MDRTLIKHMALAALLLTGAFLKIPTASAEDNAPPSTTATRPAKTLPEQTSIPNNAPPGVGYSNDGRSQPGQDHQER
jgi:hypothetical protein